MSNARVVLGELHSERDAFLLAHWLHDRRNRMHGLTHRERRRLALHQAVTARSRNEIGYGRTQPEGSSVNQSKLTLPDRIGLATVSVTEGIHEEEDRTKRRPDVVSDCYHGVRAIGAGEPGDEFSAICPPPGVLSFV